LLAQDALRQQLITLGQLGITTSMEEVEKILADEFSKVLKRPIQIDALTAEEFKSSEEMARELKSEEFLSLHKARENHHSMRSLKISARAFIHADETQLDGYNLRGSFWVSHDVIHTAKLESDPVREWRDVEEGLAGIPFKNWQEKIHVQ
jgi:hypothetical protein